MIAVYTLLLLYICMVVYCYKNGFGYCIFDVQEPRLKQCFNRCGTLFLFCNLKGEDQLEIIISYL